MAELMSGTDAVIASIGAITAIDARHGEDLIGYLLRTTGGFDRARFAALLGAANEHKEGDVTIGVAARDSQMRDQARALLASTRLGAFDGHPLFDDELTRLLDASRDCAVHDTTVQWTLGALREFLLRGDADKINGVAVGLSSEVIACVVKLLTNDELITVSAKLCHALPDSHVGAPGFLGARLQPNSPTDHPDDIRWQVFCGWAYGVGDVLLGTNPVSSDPASVAVVERALQDIIHTFELDDVLPHCVLAHVDVQAAVERAAPGSTALWFQSIAGSDAANQTFDITVAKMLAHADARSGRFGMYFETGQGADCTNGHADGVDMVIHESRKYGFARALTARVGAAQAKAGTARAPWVIVNDVAGFIGPEVFRTREQLVRCCLEDLVMGKLHGLTIGLDVCATLHMDISLDDLDWCLEQVLPARPAYLMALPTKVDPMLGYLTTGFQDHVRLRELSGTAVNPPMQEFFESLDVLDEHGRPGPQFGDPLHVYAEYQRRHGDTRSVDVVRAEGARAIDSVRARGVFIAKGHGERPYDLAPTLDRTIRSIYDDAKLAFWATLPPEFIREIPAAFELETCSQSRGEYILHPETGERLSSRSFDVIRTQLSPGPHDLQIVVSDGLNALAITARDHLAPLMRTLRDELRDSEWNVAPETLVLRSGRVRAGYQIGEALFTGRRDACCIVHVIGERPGTGHDAMSVYVTIADGAQWSVPRAVDHDITRVVSGIALTALSPVEAARQVRRLIADRGR